MWEFFCYSPTLHLTGVFSARSTQALLTSWDHLLDSAWLAGCLHDLLYLLTSPHLWLTASVTSILLMNTGSLIKSCFSYSCQGSLFPWGRTGKKGISYKVLLLLCSFEGIPDYWYYWPSFTKSGFGVRWGSWCCSSFFGRGWQISSGWDQYSSFQQMPDVLHYLMNFSLPGSSENAQYLLSFIVFDAFCAGWRLQACSFLIGEWVSRFFSVFFQV